VPSLEGGSALDLQVLHIRREGVLLRRERLEGLEESPRTTRDSVADGLPRESLILAAFVPLLPSFLGLERLLDLIGMVVVVGERCVDLREAEVGICLENLLGEPSLLVQIDEVRDADPGVVDRSLAAAVPGLLHDVRVRDLCRYSHDESILACSPADGSAHAQVLGVPQALGRSLGRRHERAVACQNSEGQWIVDVSSDVRWAVVHSSIARSTSREAFARCPRASTQWRCPDGRPGGFTSSVSKAWRIARSAADSRSMA